MTSLTLSHKLRVNSLTKNESFGLRYANQYGFFSHFFESSVEEFFINTSFFPARDTSNTENGLFTYSIRHSYKHNKNTNYSSQNISIPLTFTDTKSKFYLTNNLIFSNDNILYNFDLTTQTLLTENMNGLFSLSFIENNISFRFSLSFNLFNLKNVVSSRLSGKNVQVNYNSRFETSINDIPLTANLNSSHIGLSSGFDYYDDKKNDLKSKFSGSAYIFKDKLALSLNNVFTSSRGSLISIARQEMGNKNSFSTSNSVDTTLFIIDDDIFFGPNIQSIVSLVSLSADIVDKKPFYIETNGGTVNQYGNGIINIRKDSPVISIGKNKLPTQISTISRSFVSKIDNFSAYKLKVTKPSDVILIYRFINPETKQPIKMRQFTAKSSNGQNYDFFTNLYGQAQVVIPRNDTYTVSFNNEDDLYFEIDTSNTTKKFFNFGNTLLLSKSADKDLIKDTDIYFKIDDTDSDIEDLFLDKKESLPTKDFKAPTIDDELDKLL